MLLKIACLSYKYDLSATSTCIGADVNEKVGGPQDVFIMFDDDNRVANLFQRFQHANEAFCVTAVQADAGLVEDIERSDQAAAQRRGEVDALAFSAA